MKDTVAPRAEILTARSLRLAYGRGVLALDDLSLDMKAGCHGLLGANGAGKSTLIKVLLGLLTADSGAATVLGRDVATEQQEVRRRVGYMPERDAHVPAMTALDYVSLMGELSGLRPVGAVKRAHEVLHYVGLDEVRYRPADGFSAGMKQRLKLATAIVHDPDLLFLDEPTNGLDPKGRRYMLDLISSLSASGISLVVSTHLLPDVQEVCESVVVVSKGRVTRTGSVAELTRGLERQYELTLMGAAAPFVSALEKTGVQCHFDPTTGIIRAELSPGMTTRTFLEASHTLGVGIRTLTPGTRSLEEVFMESVEEASHGGA